MVLKYFSYFLAKLSLFICISACSSPKEAFLFLSVIPLTYDHSFALFFYHRSLLGGGNQKAASWLTLRGLNSNAIEDTHLISFSLWPSQHRHHETWPSGIFTLYSVVTRSTICVQWFKNSGAEIWFEVNYYSMIVSASVRIKVISSMGHSEQLSRLWKSRNSVGWSKVGYFQWFSECELRSNN